jgi:AcrR family transcriptional regulator
MAVTKPDRRIERTRSALLTAFRELLLTRGFVALSVEDIAARANVGRSTFYTHFKSREDILQKSLERPSAPLAALAASNEDAPPLLPWLIHFHGQRRLNSVIFETPVREIWIKCLAGMIQPYIESALRRTRVKPDLPPPMIAAIVAQAQITVIATWLRLWPHIDPETIARALEATTRVQLTVHLEQRRNAAYPHA